MGKLRNGSKYGIYNHSGVKYEKYHYIFGGGIPRSKAAKEGSRPTEYPTGCLLEWELRGIPPGECNIIEETARN
jgi:hypothetical protein